MNQMTSIMLIFKYRLFFDFIITFLIFGLNTII